MPDNPMSRVLDPEGAHLAALRRLAEFQGRRVLELGCGDGRLTVGLAADAASVLAFDPDAEAVAGARRSLPAELARRVAYHVASGTEIELEREAFDLAVFSWSL
jgi:predicted RNA methylase